MVYPHYSVGNKQSGAVLIVALVILLILTILGVAVIESSVVEERVAGNTLDKNVAFQAAEAGLRAAEADIDSWPDYPDPVTTLAAGAVMSIDSIAGSPAWWEGKDDSWWASANTSEYVAALAGTAQNPRYVVEEYDQVCDSVTTPTISDCKIIYRVTAIAWGGRNTTVLLQSLYARRY